MHTHLLALFALVQHATLSLSAPTSSGINAAPLVARQMQQNVTLLRTNPMLNTLPVIAPALIASNPNTITYHVPATRTILYIQLTAPLPMVGISSTLLLALSYVETHLTRFGDMPLSSGNDEPFNWNAGLGVKVQVASMMGQHMTYGILQTVLKGIRDFLYANHRYVGAMFKVAEGDVGMVGSGFVEAWQRV